MKTSKKLTKGKKKQLGLHIESLRERILDYDSRLQKFQDNVNTLEDEKIEFEKNLDAIFDRGITVLQMKRRVFLWRYDVNSQNRMHNALFRKNGLDIILEHANERCDQAEQMINCNSMCSFLNDQQTVEDSIKRFLNMPVEDFTYDKNDSEENTDFNDYLRSFNRLVDNLDITVDTTSLLKLAKGR